MNRNVVSLAAVAVLTASLVAACGSDDTEAAKSTASSASSSVSSSVSSAASSASKSADQSVTVVADGKTCTSSIDEAHTGVVAFDFTNNSGETAELYVLDKDGRTLGEVANVGDKEFGKLTVEFREAGTYTLRCKPSGAEAEFEVVGADVDASVNEERQAAVDSYVGYVRGQVSEQLGLVNKFNSLIQAGDLEGAKAVYAATRQPWERIEPVAEALPNDLDPRVDAREADLEAGDEFTGFHKIEKDLFETGAITDETKATATQLVADVEELKAAVEDPKFATDLTVFQIAAGAQELLDEIATSKITGEEDIYSGTDLWDFKANLDGSRQAVVSLQDLIARNDHQLPGELMAAFGAVEEELSKYRENDGFVNYATVSEEQRKELSHKLSELTELVSKIQEVLNK
ncbi:iron uptake system protein EfeO [Corynebacterium choanae]|uniref:Putative iron uptake system component EfeM n=1 Tax=Corynebacterium choanae TaxID=1862358 RepID=A0A3G6J6F3_9CORY|nr:iron uptake system protein EfeO [Corynebacterium choanae]AZA12498.1 putative iron uptake system component EfeM precursor [Corynebacterium choanae]